MDSATNLLLRTTQCTPDYRAPRYSFNAWSLQTKGSWSLDMTTWKNGFGNVCA